MIFFSFFPSLLFWATHSVSSDTNIDPWCRLMVAKQLFGVYLFESAQRDADARLIQFFSRFFSDNFFFFNVFFSTTAFLSSLLCPLTLAAFNFIAKMKQDCETAAKENYGECDINTLNERTNGKKNIQRKKVPKGWSIMNAHTRTHTFAIVSLLW